MSVEESGSKPIVVVEDNEPRKFANVVDRRQKRVYTFLHIIFGCSLFGWAMALVAFVVAISAFTQVLLFLGTCVSQMTLDASSATIHSMVVQKWEADRFFVDVNCTMDNRSPLGAQLAESTIEIGFGGRSFAKFTQPSMMLNSGFNPMILKNAEFTVINKQAFTKFVDTALEQRSVRVEMTGFITITMNGLKFIGLNMAIQTDVQGVNQFVDNPPEVQSIDITRSLDKNNLEALINLELVNPGSLAMPAGILRMAMTYMDKQIGIVTSKGPVTLHRGSQMIENVAVITKTKENAGEVRAFMSAFVSGEAVVLVMRGLVVSEGDHQTPELLRASVPKMKVVITMPGMKPENALFRPTYSELKLDALNLGPVQKDFSKDPIYQSCLWSKSFLKGAYSYTFIKVINPFTADMTVKDLDLKTDLVSSISKNCDLRLPDGTSPTVMEVHGADEETYLPGHSTMVIKQHQCVVGDVLPLQKMALCTKNNPSSVVHLRVAAEGSLLTCIGDDFCLTLDISQKAVELYYVQNEVLAL